VTSTQHLRGKLAMMALSLLISLLLWLQVQSQTRPAALPEIFNVPLQVRNLDESRFAVTRQPVTVAFRATGTPEQLNQIQLDRLAAYVEVDEPTEGLNRYEVKLDMPTTYTARITPERRAVELEVERVVQRQIVVSVEPIGLLMAPGLIFSGAQSDPDVVTLEGPKSQVDQVAKVRALLDLSKVQPRTAYPVNLEPLRENNRPLGLVRTNPAVVLIRPALAPAPMQQPLIVVPRFTGTPAFGFRVASVSVRPTQVFVTGSSEALAAITTVETQPIEIGGIRQTRTFRAALDLPTGIRREGRDPVEVTVVVEPDPGTPTPPPSGDDEP
jgi:YbbR domain-containing protein